MAEEQVDANKETQDAGSEGQNSNILSVDEKMDKAYDEFEASSASKRGTEETETQDTGVDQSKKANLEKETKSESTPEDKLTKIKEILGDDEKAIDAYIKSKGYHTDPAWQKLLEKSKGSTIDEETQKQLDDFKQVTSSREYVETAMKAKGFTQEAINAELKKRGFDVEEQKGSDIDLITKQLNIDPKTLDENTRAVLSDVSKVVDIMLKDRLEKILPTTLKPFEDGMNKITQRDNASQLNTKMLGLVETEGVLDFKEDIQTPLNEWLDKNPEATQQQAFDKFLEINHSLSIERLKTGKKRTENLNTKKNLRKDMKQTVSGQTMPKKTGDFDTDADNVLDALGVQ